MLKRILIVAALFCLVVSCSKGSNEPVDTDVKEAMGTREIVDKYIETVTTAKGKAQAVSDQALERANRMNAIGHTDDQHTDRP